MIVNEIPHHIMMQAARKVYRQIEEIRREGYPAARVYAERVYPNTGPAHHHTAAHGILAACRRADLALGPYYWADEPTSLHGAARRRVCRGIQIAVDLQCRYTVCYVPLFCGPAKRAA